MDNVKTHNHAVAHDGAPTTRVVPGLAFEWKEGSEVAVVGAQYGDEGKGKLVDILSRRADICCRYNGGANAGHTIVIDGNIYPMHLLPCGIFEKQTKNLLGSGMVIHLPTLMSEIRQLQKVVPDCLERLYICKRAHLVLDCHLREDQLQEEEKKLMTVRDTSSYTDTSSPSTTASVPVSSTTCPNNTDKSSQATHNIFENGSNYFMDSFKSMTCPNDTCRDLGENKSYDMSIGTTRRGIGPTYAAKCRRDGLRVADLMKGSEERLKCMYHYLRRNLKCRYRDILTIDEDEMKTEQEELLNIQDIAEVIRPRIVDGVHFLSSRKQESRILVEGANGMMLDNSFGTYPNVTSSTTLVGGVVAHLGQSFTSRPYIIGVVKAYTTRVGNGPLPTEDFGDVGDHLLKIGNEYGTTTRRPRRCGWLDIPQLRYSHTLNGYDSLMLTKLDVLTNLEYVWICVDYLNKATVRTLYEDEMSYMLTDTEFESVYPVYKKYNGWTEDISKIKTFDDLPINAKIYVESISQLLDIPICMIGVGPGRDQIIYNN